MLTSLIDIEIHLSHVSGVVALLELKALAGRGRLTEVGLPVATVLCV